MNKQISCVLFMLLIACMAFSQETGLKKGMVIRKSMKIRKAVYDLKASDSAGATSVIVIEGNNITVDFNHARLRGQLQPSRPDLFAGTAIHVRKGKNITIKNLQASGYKIAILGTDVEGLRIENCDLSYNYRPRLNSTQEKEDISDWMSYHHNEKQEWKRYGAAIYLFNCNKAEVKNCRVTGGQNALMLSGCNNGLFYNNDFSFNSGIGIGMYRSSNNRVLYNRLNFNVRGYSHGIYNRGQDSAGILVYEQSHQNIFYKNSATHSGDGFFLWAGQTTMDTGEGGCNGNRIWNNDFSYAPTNGIEVTFSSNFIADNRIYECDHGIWGGYSFNTVIKGNKFRYNRIAIAIEHGQDNQIINNLFLEDREAIRLWARREQPADWIYAQRRDTRSRNYLIALNSFNRNRYVFNLNRTDSLQIFGNTYSDCDTLFKADSQSTAAIDTGSYFIEDTLVGYPYVKDPMDPFRGGGRLAGRKHIRMTEWGPYDYRYPLIWLANPADTSGTMQFEVIGPKGKWKILSVKGLTLEPPGSDSLPTQLKGIKTSGFITDMEILAEYKSAAPFTDPFGNKVPAGRPYRFAFKKFFQPIDFQVRWYALDSSSNPLTQPIMDQVAFKTERVSKLDYAWWGGIKEGGQTYPRFFTRAEGKTKVAPGKYLLSVTWDDAVRVWVDDRLVLDEWEPSRYRFDESPNRRISLSLGGEHRIRVEHLELGGFATLSMKLLKAE